MGILSQAWPLNYHKRYVVTKDMPIAEAREYIAARAVELGATYLWFLDDDTIPPSGAIRFLKYQLDQNPDVGAIGAIVCTKTAPPEPVVFKHAGEGTFWDWKVGEVFECDRVSVACMVIRVDALKSMPKPWFQMSDDSSESMYFCKGLREAGFKILAHGGVLCTHIDMDTGIGYGLPVDSAPCKTADKEMLVTA